MVRDIFRAAFRKKVQGLLLARTSPSADLEPTDQEWDLADCLTQTGDLLGVPVRDYLITAERNYYSFADCSLLEFLDLFSRCKFAFMCEEASGPSRSLLASSVVVLSKMQVVVAWAFPAGT